jgi:two-component system, cell cycle sensor histidine kinase and response regulator CckA
MIGVGAFDATAGALQLVVPSYGLRLVRRFGTQRVGWFLVTAFVSLAALHLLEPMNPTTAGSSPDIVLNIVYAVGSVLLLVGMGHMDTFFSQYERSRTSEENLNQQWEQRVQKNTAHLARANEALQEEIVRRQHAEAVLRESELQYRFLFTENPRPMWVFDLRECRFLAVNKAALRHYGFTAEEFSRFTVQDLFPPEQVETFMADVSRSCVQTESRGFWKHYRKDQSLMDVEILARDLTYSGAPARLVVIDDLTQLRRRENETFQASKMELIARITGGVAHRFNDILTVIETHTALVRQRPVDPKAAEELQEISVAASRGTNLGYQMLAASGRQLVMPRPLDLNRLITNLNLILRRVAGDKVTFQNLCNKTPLPVIADPKVIEHTLISLIKNARDAMPEKGMVTVNTTLVNIAHPPIRQDSDSTNTEFVRISVRDTGCGMPPDVQEHLFEPFFSTKSADKGQGLGLACIFGAIRQHWGWIECTTTVGAGTEFRIFLPCAPKSLLPSTSEIQAATTLNRGTVLVVDADDRSRGVARYVLNRNGYRVIEADSTAIALVLWEGQARNIDLVLTELVLAGTSGFDLANQLRQTRTDLKVIYACGNEAEMKNHEATLPKGMKLIAKPYRSDELVEQVESLLPRAAAQ